MHRFPSVAGARADRVQLPPRRRQVRLLPRSGSTGERFRYRNYGHAPSGPVVNDCAIPAQPLEEFRFLGRGWLKVRDHDAELTALYGDWRTPCVDWNYLDGPAIVATGPWDDTGYDSTAPAPSAAALAGAQA